MTKNTNTRWSQRSWPLVKHLVPGWFLRVHDIASATHLEITAPCHSQAGLHHVITMSRKDARMLAKRITQMLDETA